MHKNMMRRVLAALLLLAVPRLSAALSANSVWEVRTAGNDKNGGGFVTGASGTDWSIFDNKNASGCSSCGSSTTDLSVTDGVTAGTTTVTSITANFQTTIVGNIIYIEGGTGSITGAWYQVTARASTTSITVDRSTGLTTGTGVTLNIGGALLTIQKALDNITVVGMQVYVKADGTYSISTGLTDSNGSSTTTLMVIRGYTSTRTDDGKATIQASAAITMLTISAQGHAWRNFIIDGNSDTGTNGVNVTGGRSQLRNLIVKNLSGYGVQTSSSTAFYAVDVEIFGCDTTAGLNVSNATAFARRLYIHDNTVPGVVAGGGTLVITDSTIESNSGASSDGVQTTGHSVVLIGVNLYNNGRDGFRITSGAAAAGGSMIVNSIMDSNAGYGGNFSGAGSSTAEQPSMGYNAYRNNGTAARNNYAAETGAVTLTGIPWTDAPNGDFTLNNTSGAGAACRAAGAPGTIQGMTGTGYRDIGAFQHQDPASSGGGGSFTFVH